MKKSRILFLSPLTGMGGEELSTLSLTRELARRGHKVVIRGNMSPLRAEFVEGGVEFVASRPYRRGLKGIAADAADIRKMVDQHDIEIIHSQSVLPTISAWLACRKGIIRKRPAIIFHHRGFHSYSYPIVGRAFNHMTDLVIANSDFEKKRLVKNGMNESHCVRVYNSINIRVRDAEKEDRDARGIPPVRNDTIMIGTVGRLVKEKGLFYLLEAFKKVNRVVSNTALVIIGDGVLRKPLQEGAIALGIGDRVVFAGAKRNLHEVYRDMDLFVLASVSESFGNVALEAAYFGKPVVATKVGGLPEAVLDGVTGLLVAPGESGCLAEAIIQLIRDRDTAMRLGRAGQERAATYFTPMRLGDEIEQVYSRLLAS